MNLRTKPRGLPPSIALLFASFLISCQSLPQKESDWTNIGGGDLKTIEAISDCQQRANGKANSDDVTYNYEDNYGYNEASSDAYAGALALLVGGVVIGQQFGWQKTFDRCMNVKGFSRQEDVERVKDEYQKYWSSANAQDK